MRQLYEKINKRLDTINFEAIYPGFTKLEFVLYNDTTAWLEDREITPHDFRGNTTVSFEGKQIAIWYVDQETSDYDIDTLIVGIVHEMFHSFQFTHDWEAEWPDDFMLLRYPMDEEHFLVKQQENQMLAKAMDSELSEKIELCHSILASRNLRRIKYNDFFHQEELIEKWEGSAECAGLLALKQISLEKYHQQVKEHVEILKNGEYLLDVRKNTFYSGALMYLLKKEVGENKSKIVTSIRFVLKEKEARMDEFFRTPRKKVTAEGFICGYDPMNQIRIRDRILSSHFIAINVNGEVVMLQKPVVLQLKAGTDNEIISYWE